MQPADRRVPMLPPSPQDTLTGAIKASGIDLNAISSTTTTAVKTGADVATPFLSQASRRRVRPTVRAADAMGPGPIVQTAAMVVAASTSLLH